jgi:hypothetical protein
MAHRHSVLSSKAIFAGSVLLAFWFVSASALGESAAIRFDGLYHRTNREHATQLFRFYRDGTVISVVIAGGITPRAKLERWFQRGWPSIATGRYSVRGDSVEITLKPNLPGPIPEEFRRKIPATLLYSGEIGPGYLLLRQGGSAEEKRHDFLRVGFIK